MRVLPPTSHRLGWEPRPHRLSRTRQVHELQSLAHQVSALRARLERIDRDPRLRGIHPLHRDSARNLLQYLAFRHADLRALQDALARWGLSSLGRCEGDVLAQVRAVERLLKSITGHGHALPCGIPRFGRAMLERHAREHFGEAPGPEAHVPASWPRSPPKRWAITAWCAR